MKKITVLLSLLLLTITSFAQSNNNKIIKQTGDQYVGMNLLQYTSLTINANYSKEYKPWFTGFVEIGYTLNYSKTQPYDVIGYLLTAHSKDDNLGYDPYRQNGGYIKLGGYYNFRKSYETKNFIHLGAFLTNSFIYEKAGYLNPDLGVSGRNVNIAHGVLLSGLSVSAGYEFKFLKIFTSTVDFQVSLPTGNYEDLYGYSNFIPGMGHKDFDGYWFPMLIWNLKYKL